MLKYTRITDYGDDSLVRVELGITAEADDWCKFRSQSFYRPLMKYLENEGTAQRHAGSDVLPNTPETQPSPKRVNRDRIESFLAAVHKIFSRHKR